MMDLVYASFFGAGVAAFIYAKLGRRVGYGNSSNVALIVGAFFVMSTIVFFTILHYFIHVE